MAEETEDPFADVRDGGKPKSSKVLTSVPKDVPADDPWVDVKKAPDTYRTNTSMGEARQTRKQDYIEYMPEGVYSDSDIDLKRAQSQSVTEQIGRTLGNLVPNITTGLLENAGYLGSLVTEWGDDRDYTNFLVEGMKAAHNPFGETYREDNEVWSMGDSAWWLQNFSSLAESAAEFAIIGSGVGALFGRGAGLLAESLKAGSMGTRIATGTAHGLTAATLAYTEGAQIGYTVYEKAYNTQLKRLLDAGNSPEEADSQAKHIASQAAATTVQLNTAINTVLNVPQLAVLFKTTDDIYNMFRRGSLQRLAGESLETYGQRVAAAQLPKNVLKGMAIEAGSEGLEEVVNQFAERTGYAQGADKKGKTSGFWDNVGELSNFFDRTLDSEGALNFMLGAVGGVAQGALISRIPVRREIQRDADDNAIPVLDAAGEIVTDANGKPKYQVKLVSAHTMEQNGRRQYFENIKDAVQKDITWLQTKQAELVTAIADKNLVKADQLRQEIGSVQQLGSVTMGLTDAWKQEYQNIQAIDNTKDLAEPHDKRVAEILREQFELLKQEGIEDPTKLTGEALEAYQQLNAEKEQEFAQAEKLRGTTVAMQKGFAKNKEDHSYKDTAAKQIKRLEMFEKIYDDVQERFFGSEEAKATGIADHIFRRKADIYLRGEVLNEYEAKLQAAENENQQAITDLNADPLNQAVRQYYTDLQNSSDTVGYLQAESKALRAAVLAYATDPSKLGRILSRYKMSDFDLDSQESAASAAARLDERLNNQAAKEMEKINRSQDNIRATQQFNDWIKDNADGKIDSFLGTINPDEKQQRVLLRADLRKSRLHLEQMKLEQQSAQEELQQVESEKGLINYTKAALRDRKRILTAMEEKIKEDNKNIETDERNRSAGATLQEYQSRILVEQNLKEIGRVQVQIQELQASMQAVRDAITERNKSAKVKIRSLIFGSIEETQLKSLKDQIGILQAKVLSLQLQNENLLSGLPIEPEAVAPVPVVEPQEIVEPTVATPAETIISPQSSAAASYETILQSLDQDHADWIRSILEPVVEGTEPFSWDLLDSEIAMGDISAPLAAKLLNNVNVMLGQEEVSPVDAAEDPIFESTIEDTTNPVQEPDSTDVAPEDSDLPVEDSPIDIPSAGVESDIPVSPFTDLNDPIELEQDVLHIGTKSIDGLKINNMTLDYEETKDGDGNYVIRTITNKINENTSDKVLKPNGLQPGQKVRLEVDTEYKGTVNKKNEAGQQPDSFFNYADENNKVGTSQEIAGNVPIKIVDDATGEILGYLPRVDWITAQYPGAADYRNVVDEYEQNGVKITDNVKQQVERLMYARRKIVDRFNAGNGATATTISDRGPGKTILNFEEKDGKIQVVKKSASTLLPDPNLKFGIVSGGVVKLSSSTIFEGKLNNTDLSQMNNAPFALLPMADGSYSLGRIDNYTLDKRPFDINTAVHALETYLLGDEETGEKYMQLTGFDILSDDGIRSFITQHYTYIQNFSDSVTAADAIALEGKPRRMEFMFNIANRTDYTEGNVKIGFSYSGRPVITARIVNGRLAPDFEKAFREGLATRYKAVTFTDLSKGKFGLNSVDEIDEVVWDGKTLKVRKSHKNYNEYLKSFSETPVNGTNQLADDTYVYGANPQNLLDLSEIQRALVTTTPNAAVIEDVQPDIIETPQGTDTTQLTDAERELLDGFMDMKMPAPNTPMNTTIDGGRPVSLQSLNDLLTFTPVNKQNGKTAEQVIQELSTQGITQLAPGYNPFYKC